MSQDIFLMMVDIIMKKCPGVISNHNDNAILISLPNMTQKEGLMLNTNKLELKRGRASILDTE